MTNHPSTFDLPRPHDIDSEQQLLGELLLNNATAERLIGRLDPAQFVEPLHARICEAILRAVKAGLPATPHTLQPEFEHDAAMCAVGGTAYLATLAARAGECVDAAAWAQAIANLAQRRALIAAARDIQDAAFRAPIETEPAAIAERAEELLAGAMHGANGAVEHFRALGDLAREVMTAKAVQPAVTFGLDALDELTGGLRAKELVIVGARPGMGKTAFAGHLALEAAKQGKGVVFFSMEMAASAIALRLIAAHAFAHGASVPYDEARRGRLDARQRQALLEAQVSLSALPLFIHEGRQLTPSGLALAAKRAQKKLRDTATPLGLVLVDHIQKIRPDRDCKGNKVAEMTEISDALQKMAGTLDIPVVALSQLNRAVESRESRRPELADLRESGAIEQDADLVLLLYREAYYVKKREPHREHPEWDDWFTEFNDCRHALDIHVAKQRNGREGHVRTHFDAPSSGIR